MGRARRRERGKGKRKVFEIKEKAHSFEFKLKEFKFNLTQAINNPMQHGCSKPMLPYYISFYGQVIYLNLIVNVLKP